MTTTASITSRYKLRSVSSVVAERLRSDLLDTGDLSLGDRLPSLSELENRYGYSRVAIVHALSLLEQEGRVERRRGVGTFVTSPNEAIAVAKTGLIGLIANNTLTWNYVALGVYNGLADVARLNGWHVVLSRAVNIVEEEREVDRLVASGCRGVIVIPRPRTQSDIENDYLNRKHLDFPIILVDMALPTQNRTQVVFDNYQSGVDMTQLLIERGHKRIAFVRWTPKDDQLLYYSTDERARGYRDAIAGAALEPLYWNVDKNATDEVSRAHIESLMRNSLSDPARPTAAIALHDPWAMTMIGLAWRMGLRVPEDFTIAGFDNAPASSEFALAFPTTGPDFRSAGRLAARLATRPYEGFEVEGRIHVLPAPVIDR
ncbi:MAG: GntR family transcriptional regulator [Capsulimonadaceae bacterium]|nr:GntR family transcriptional regulator [Capsulimonadaceae bacterium]